MEHYNKALTHDGPAIDDEHIGLSDLRTGTSMGMDPCFKKLQDLICLRNRVNKRTKYSQFHQVFAISVTSPGFRIRHHHCEIRWVKHHFRTC